MHDERQLHEQQQQQQQQWSLTRLEV